MKSFCFLLCFNLVFIVYFVSGLEGDLRYKSHDFKSILMFHSKICILYM